MNVLIKIFNDCDLFAAEKPFLLRAGFWPLEINITRIVFFSLLDFLFATLPGFKFFVDAWAAKHIRSIALVVPELLLSIVLTTALIVSLVELKVTKRYLKQLEEEWFRDESLEWKLIRDESAKFWNRASILANCSLHVAGIFYYVIPQIVFIVNFYILKDPTVEKQTIFMAEYFLIMQ